MRAGGLRHRITIEKPSYVRDSVGEPSLTWSAIGTVWADIQPVRARELIAGGKEKTEITHKVIIRYSSTLASQLDEACRILFGSRILSIVGVINTGERNQMIELACIEGMKDT